MLLLCAHSVCACVCVFVQEEQAAKLKADNIRVALEKIKEAQVKKVSEEKENEAAKKIRLRVQLGACSIFLRLSVCCTFSGSGQCHSTSKALVNNSWDHH